MDWSQTWVKMMVIIWVRIRPITFLWYLVLPKVVCYWYSGKNYIHGIWYFWLSERLIIWGPLGLVQLPISACSILDWSCFWWVETRRAVWLCSLSYHNIQLNPGFSMIPLDHLLTEMMLGKVLLYAYTKLLTFSHPPQQPMLIGCFS